MADMLRSSRTTARRFNRGRALMAGGAHEPGVGAGTIARAGAPWNAAGMRDRSEAEPHDLAGLFAAPRWLRDFGTTAWLAVGVALLVVATVTILALTHTIVMPVLTAAVVGAVASPLIGRFERRGIAAALFLVTMIVLSVAIITLVLGAITGELDAVRGELSSAKDTLAGWLSDLGVDRDTAEAANADASSAVSAAVPALLEGIAGGLRRLSSLVVYLSLTALSLFFLLKDGPLIRHWAEGHMRVPRPVAHAIGDRVLQSLRGYFLGVTFVAIFNGVVVGLGALLFGVPLAGTIVVVTFLGAYVPYLGAWGAGAFTVLIALGGAGTDAAIAMIVVQLLANGLLQQLVQPIAYSAALDIHPLAVLIVTIAGGALFGAVGLILAAPLTAAATRVAEDLARGAPAEADAVATPA
jgi:putative heme transporter